MTMARTSPDAEHHVKNNNNWWCPTAGFSPLQLHATVPYREGQKGVPDLYVSSYTTTLVALKHVK